MRLRCGSFLLGWLLCGCSHDEAGVRPVPLPECPDHDYAACDTRHSDCQERLLALAACAYGASELPDVPIRVLSEDEFRRELEAGTEQPDAAEAAEDEYVESVLVDLGMVEAGDFSVEGSVDAVVDNFAGVYQDASTGIVIVDRGQPQSSVDADSLLLHELVHALQDADYDLKSWLEPHLTTTDEVLAVKSLSEGEATYYQFRIAASMLGYDVTRVDFEATFENLRQDLNQRAYASTAPYITSFATFPYAYGSIMALRGDRGSEAFASPPLTTLDVLLRADSPALSAAGRPEPLAAPEAPADFELITEDSFGAWNLGLFLNVHGFDDEAVAGLPFEWENDQLWLYQSADSRGWLWEVELDDEAAAAAIASGLAGQLPKGLEVTQQGRGSFIVGGGTPQFLLDAGQAFLDSLE